MQHSGLPKEHLELISEMERVESILIAPDSLFAPATVAKALTCLAHDYIQIGLEERGYKLLLKADDLFPGYHGLQMKQDMAEDPDFAMLGRSLSAELILVLLSTARDNR